MPLYKNLTFFSRIISHFFAIWAKFININTAFENGTLRILIENSANNDVKFDGPFPISQKANPSGIGTKNIYELAQKYNGLCDYSLANGIFTARLILVVK